MNHQDSGQGGYSSAYAQVYEPLHSSRGWDWRAEARGIAADIRRLRPTATSVLDIACGTGDHMAEFAGVFDRVAGVELSAAMRRVAQSRHPQLSVYAGDMRCFALEDRFDAVTCLSYSIAYMPNGRALDEAVVRMAEHLLPGGILVLEPWWGPDTFLDNYVSGGLHRDAERVITRVSHSRRTGDTCRMKVHVTVADRQHLTQFTEVENLTLFSDDQYAEALARGGFADLEWQRNPPSGRRRILAVLQSG